METIRNSLKAISDNIDRAEMALGIDGAGEESALRRLIEALRGLVEHVKEADGSQT